MAKGKKNSMKKRSEETHQNGSGGKRINTSKVDNEEPIAKRLKESKWYPGKFVLLKHSQGNNQNSKESSSKSHKKNTSSSEESSNEETESKTNEDDSNNSQNIQSNVNLNFMSKEKKRKLSLEDLYADDGGDSDDDWSDTDELTSSSDDYGDDEDEYEEDSFIDHSSETDYSTQSDNSTDINNYCLHDNSDDDYDSSDDVDYVPDIEDKYVKFGTAVKYEGNGLDAIFGDTNDSQLVDFDDFNITLDVNKDDDDDGSADEDEDDKFDETMIGEMKLDEDDDEEDNKLVNTYLGEHAKLYNCINDQGVVVRLIKTIHFHGLIRIKVIVNNVEVNGYTLKEHEVLSSAASISRGDYFLNLTPIICGSYEEEKTNGELKNLLSEDDFNLLISNFNPGNEVLVHLQQVLPNVKIEAFKAYYPHSLLPNKKMLTSKNSLNSELLLATKFFTANENQKLNTFQINEQWRNLEITNQTRLVVVGGKNVGKSGLSQYLINDNIRKFKKILLIDFDIGQPICGPAQTISVTLISEPIIGAGYLNDYQPDKCLIYGDKSIMISPFKYVRCIRQLIEFCRSNDNYENIPWIVNTMGYQKGLGLEIICLVLKILQPTDVVQIQHNIQSFNFASVITESFVNEFSFTFFNSDDLDEISKEVFFTTHVLDSIVNNRMNNLNSKWISNASEKRKLSMLAQLSKILNVNQICFNDVTPFVSPSERIQIVIYNEDISQHDRLPNFDLLNGNLVYLCQSFDDSKLDSNSILDCHGVGIVRAIDKINKRIYILLPQSNENDDNLKTKVNVLAIGNIPLPSEIIFNQGFEIKGKLPYVTSIKDRSFSNMKYLNKRDIKDCF